MRRAAILLLLLAAMAPAAGLAVSQTIRPPFYVAAWRLTDVNNDGRGDLLMIGSHGEVRVWMADPATGRLEPEPRGTLVLPDPRHTLVALADVLGEGGPPQLVTVSPNGALAYPVTPDGAFASQGRLLARRARFKLRTNEPRFAAIAQDINNDGTPDLVVPGSEKTEIWLNRGAKLRRAARISVEVDRADRTDGDELSDRLRGSFRIPRLRTDDVNGDGRPDLLVKTGRTHAFHMQRDDGSIPPEPDVVLDLRIFRDTTPKAELRPGSILAGSDKARFQSRDLDEDGIPDYVIAHRRKVWVFHGNGNRPQFVDPTTILKVSDDVTALLIVNLDEDKYPDLLLFKVQIPSVAGIISGLVSSMEIDISALGYRNEGGRRFGRSPAWRSELTVRIPPITRIMKDPSALLSRFEQIGRKFRPRRVADLTGSGKGDVLLMNEDGTRFDIWLGAAQGKETADVIEVESTIREVIFDDPDKTWDIDRLFSFANSIAEQRNSSLTDGRAPDTSYPLRPGTGFLLLDFQLGDLDGDGKAGLVLRYVPYDAAAMPIFDIVRWKE